MAECLASAVIGLNARTGTAGDLHDVWRDRLAGRGNSEAGSTASPSLEQELCALINGAWADAFGETTPRRAITFFATFGDYPVRPDTAYRVINRVGGQFAEPPSQDPALEILQRAVAVAARHKDTPAVVVIADGHAHGAVLILEAPEQAARRNRSPYALVECGDADGNAYIDDAGDAVGIVNAVLAVAFGTIPPSAGGRMWPWLAEERVMRLGKSATVVRQWQHAIANRHCSPPTRSLFRIHQPLLLAAGSRDELLVRIREFRDGEPAKPATGPVRLAIVAADPSSTLRQLAGVERSLAAGGTPRHGAQSVFFTDSAPARPRSLAFLLPGQGSQYAGMLADVVCHFPSVRSWYERLDRNDPAQRPSRWFFEPARNDEQRDENNRRVFDPETGGHGGFVASMALHELLTAMGLKSEVLLGYSNGENAALFLSGAIGLRDREHLFDILLEVRRHAHAADVGGRLPKGITVAVTGATRERVAAAIAPFAGRAFISMDNCPSQVIVFGEQDALQAATSLLKSEGAVCLTLPFERAYHTPLFEGRARHIRKYYDTLDFRTPRKTIYSCATASAFPLDAASIREIAALQWHTRVLFRDTIERLYRVGIADFIEVGAAARLTGYVHDILRGRPHSATPTNVEERSGIIQLQNVAAQAFIAGWDVDLSIFRRVEPAPTHTHHARVVTASETAPRRKNPRLIQAPLLTPAGSPTIATRPGAVAANASAAAVMEAHFELMNEFLESQQRAFAAAIRSCALAPQPESWTLDAAWPFLGRIVRLGHDRLEAIRTFSVTSDAVMYEHTLGRPAAADHFALAVLPLNIAMEMMAEAAAKIAGHSFVVTALRDIRAHRWVTADHGLARVRTRATTVRASADAIDVEVALFDLSDGGETAPDGLAFAGIVELRRGYASSQPTIAARTEQPEAGLLYDARAFYDHCMFHGPLFQMIRRVHAFDESGIEAELELPDHCDLVLGLADPRLQLPALLLDAPGQLIAYWLVERGHEFFGEFPYQIGSVTFHRRIEPQQRLTSRCSISHDGTTSNGTFEVYGDDGSVAIRVSDFNSRHYLFDREYLSVLYWPGPHAYISSDVNLGGDAIIRCIGQLAPGFLTSSHGIWSRGLAHMTLQEAELATFYALPTNGLRRAEWLLGRVAAKDAVRVWAAANLGIDLDIREIGIAVDALGKPGVVCARIEGNVLHLSIAHSSARAVAVVAASAVGIDFELASRTVPPEAFDEDERRLWNDDGALLPLWCAREAAAKASGRALEGAWKKWRIAEVSDDHHRIVVNHAGDFYNVQLTVQSDQVFALCIS
jgi:malonyl CoA-acyl carrier protein transacylase/phosphopantetheinyl transferase